MMITIPVRPGRRSFTLPSRTKKFQSTIAMSTSTSSDFYKSIGSPKFICAPMVEQSELAFRILTRRHGVDLTYTQMMHARNFMNIKKYRADCIDWLDYSSSSASMEVEAQRLDRPLIAQFAGDDPYTVVKAALYVHDQVSAVDLNLGCPQKIAKRGNYGAYLLPDKKKVISVLDAMVRNLNCPVTAKIRRLPSEAETIELCQEIESIGVKMITIHGRTVESSKQYTGPADWDIIRTIKQSVSIPVIANGGISCRADALRCLAETGVDGVMSSEALLENPKLFSQEGDQLFQDNYITAQLLTVREYLSILQSLKPPSPLLAVTRGHLFKMLYRFLDAPKNLDLRAQLAETNFAGMLEVVDKIEDRVGHLKDSSTAESEGLLNSYSWYMRHRHAATANRVLIPKRVRGTGGRGIESGAQIIDKYEKQHAGLNDVKAHMSDLKEKLKAKRLAAVQSVEKVNSVWKRDIDPKNRINP